MALLKNRENAAPATSLLGAFVVLTFDMLKEFGVDIRIEQVNAINNWLAIVVLLVSAVVSWRKTGAQLPPGDPDTPLFPPNVPPQQLPPIEGARQRDPGGDFTDRN